MDNNFDLWRTELLQTGNLVQDGDKSVSQPERDKRFKRYLEMVEAVSGSESVAYFVALVDSLQAKHDYGAYQATYQALWRFSPNVAAPGLIDSLPRLIQNHPDHAGDILCRLAKEPCPENVAIRSAFLTALRLAPAETHKAIMDFVAREENGGWLDGRRRGVIRPE